MDRAVDPCFNTVDKMPALDMRSLSFKQVKDDSWLPATLLLEFTAADQKTKVRLADYGSLGLRGQTFQTWLSFGTTPTHTMPDNIPRVPFSKENPTRTFFVADVPPPGLPAEAAATASPYPTGLPAVLSIKLIGNGRIPSRRTRINSNFNMAQMLEAIGLQQGIALEYLHNDEWLLIQTETDLDEAKRICSMCTKQDVVLKLRVHAA